MDDNANMQTTVNEMAQMICDHYGYDMPMIEFNGRLSHTWGKCFYTKCKIELSTGFCERNDDDIVFGLIKHEIAHLKFKGHGQDFACECERMGISVHTYMDHPESERAGKYKYICIKCGRTVNFGKKLKRPCSCGKCSPGVYDVSCKLIDVTA